MNTFLPSTLDQWIGAIVIVVPLSVIGVFAVVGIFDKQKRERKKEQDDADDRLIKLLQQTVTELETKVNKYDADIQNLTKAVTELKTKNQTLLDILQGRDENTQDFYKNANEAIGVAKETNGIVKKTNENIEQLIGLMDRHLRVIETKV